MLQTLTSEAVAVSEGDEIIEIDVSELELREDLLAIGGLFSCCPCFACAPV